MQDIGGENHSEVVFKVCAKGGYFWPQCKLLVLGM